MAGADKVSFNTAAVRDPDVINAASEKFGSQCIVVAMDAKRVGDDRWEIFTHGGREATGIEAVGFARDMAARAAGEILLTSMDRDGTKSGFDLQLTRAVADAVPVPVIASGGVGTLHIWSMVWWRAVPAPSWQHRFSFRHSHDWRSTRQHWRRPVWPCVSKRIDFHPETR